LIATVVDWAALRDVVIASFAVGVGATVAFSFAILGLTRFADTRRDGRRIESVAYGALAPVLGYHIEWAGVTMLAALGIALGLMWYVLNAGESGR